MGISSGGMNAILSTLKHAREKTGLLRSAKALLQMNNAEGFDCPGCAWPEPKDRSRIEFCENGAKALMNATTTKIADGEFFKRHSIEDLRSWSEYQLSNCGRLTEPVIRREGATHFEVVSYEAAYEIVADALKKLAAPNRAVLYTSGRASNEAAFLYQLFARMLGTNNLCDCSNLCHESSGVALKRTIGVGKGTVQIDDFLEAQVIFLIGHNPSTNHPRMLTTLRDARVRGAKIVVINPLIEPGLKKFRHPQKISDVFGTAKEIATHYFQVNVGGDHALCNAVLHQLLLDDDLKTIAINHGFIADHTHGFADLVASISALDYEHLVNESGLTANEVKAIAELIANHDRVIYAWGMGITQTTYGVNTIESIANLALLRGHIGKSGAGLCPVRGHSNVQGNRTVGITEKPAPEFLTRLERVFNFSAPRDHGLDVVESIHAMLLGQVDVFMALGGNFLSAGPDTAATTAALKKCQLAVSISTALNRTHLEAGGIGLIFPSLTRVERDEQKGKEQIVSVENSMSIVHPSRGKFAPIKANIASEITVICSIAKRTLKPNLKVDWQRYNDNYDLIRDAISDSIDEFVDYNERLRNKNGFLLRNPASINQFNTTTGKAQFARVLMPTRTKEPYDLVLTTIRSHDQFNTAIYGLDDRYRGIKNARRVVFMNQADMARLNLAAFDEVDLVSVHNGKERIAPQFSVRAYEIKQGSAAAYFPEANALVPLDSVALDSNTPTSKLIPIIVRSCNRPTNK